jgi:hypothetical protein
LHWRRLRHLGGRRRGGSAGGRSSGSSAGGNTVRHHCKNSTYVDGLTFWNPDLRDHTARGRRNLRIHLVRRDLEERFVPLDRFSDLLQPAGDRTLGDGLSKLWHQDISQRANPFL